MIISPAETIDTVNISTNNFDAEQGMAGGAAITVVTKSGTNEFKGSAFEFYNNDKLNAHAVLLRRQPTAGKPAKPPVNRNIYGGTVGGPIMKNRLFFFGSFEGYKQTQNLFQFFNVPTQALRNGDFSHALNANGTQQVIYDPLTGNADGTGRTPFPGNVIPRIASTRSPGTVLGWLLSAAEHGRRRRRRSDRQLLAARRAHHRSLQLRRQGELEPHVVAPDLGQVQLPRRGRGRSHVLPDPRSERLG